MTPAREAPNRLAHGTLCLLASLCAMSIPGDSVAQSIATPNAHWGTIMVPDMGHRVDWGLHFLGFTQYGKEVFAGTDQFTFSPYNDIDETLGFNFLALSHTDDGRRFPVDRSSLQTRVSAFIGIVDDHIPEYLQNDVAHWGNYRGADRLRRVPRTLTDTPESTSHGPTKAVPILGYSREYFIRYDERRGTADYELTKPSRFFVGGGFVVSTINHEAFLHIGSNPIHIGPGSPWCVRGACFTSIGLGGMLRWGVLLPSVHFSDLTADFTQTQLVVDLNTLIGGFPISLSGAVTGSTGFFTEPRTAADLAVIAESERPTNSVYEVKRPKRERFIALRLRMGDFSFEFINDTFGGKDKGPSFGVHAAFVTTLDAGLLRWLGVREDPS